MEPELGALSDLVGRKFIARRDVKAQMVGSSYIPAKDREQSYLGWTRQNVVDHIQGVRNYGHYMVNTNGESKLFAFDIDLASWNEKHDRPQPMWVPILEDGSFEDSEPKPVQPREAWLHPRCPPELRRYLTAQLMGVAELLARTLMDVVEVPTAVAYSGSKGVHVYGFTGSAPARDVRGAAMEVLEYTEQFMPLRGKNFFRAIDADPRTGFGCIDVEIFPKQNDLDGKVLGNLMRLPLGVHSKSRHRATFLSLNGYIDEMKRMNPFVALEEGDPWHVARELPS